MTIKSKYHSMSVPKHTLPELPYVRCSLDRIINEELELHFPDLCYRIDWQFCPMKPLACIRRLEGSDCATIRFHSILNHPQTPESVLRDIVRHELIHLKIPSRMIKGVLEMHTPEFNELEMVIVPNKILTDTWLSYSFNSVLGNGPKGTGMVVKNRQVKKYGVLMRGRVGIEEMMRMQEWKM